MIPLLQGVNVFVWEDQGDVITGGLKGLLKAGAIGALLAIVSLYIFLRRFDSTLIVALSIPFSIIAACGAMYFMGQESQRPVDDGPDAGCGYAGRQRGRGSRIHRSNATAPSPIASGRP